uniref:Uncharacterized protein n=1 Tax=Trypanosoma congolense (strain IL3000) TaxID=1068625 RepID=G0V2Q1_TRYCI|nr:hypothetical protein, unlikely [Trypanosoma congolense IL3000]
MSLASDTLPSLKQGVIFFQVHTAPPSVRRLKLNTCDLRTTLLLVSAGLGLEEIEKREKKKPRAQQCCIRTLKHGCTLSGISQCPREHLRNITDAKEAHNLHNPPNRPSNRGGNRVVVEQEKQRQLKSIDTKKKHLPIWR